MLIYPDSLIDYHVDEQDGLLLYLPNKDKTTWDQRERKVTSALVNQCNNQVVDLGLPHGYHLDSRYKGKPIIHRFVHDGHVYWRTPSSRSNYLGQNPNSQEEWNTILDKYPSLVSPGFFYNHTLVFVQEKAKIKLLALIHLSTGELEDADEVIAVAEHFGLDYDT